MDQRSPLFDAARGSNHLVIGASGGIGAALSGALKDRGLRVFTAARQALDFDLPSAPLYSRLARKSEDEMTAIRAQAQRIRDQA